MCIYIYIYVYNTYIYIHILNIYIYIHREREREILPASSESPSGPPAWPQRARAALRATGPPIIITITITITVTSILINTSICMIHIHNNKILATRPAGPLRRRRRCSAAGPPLHESKRHFTYGYFWITCLKTITTCSYMLHVYRSAPSAAARSPELVASPRIYTNMLYIYIYIYIIIYIYIYICIMHININIYIYIYIERERDIDIDIHNNDTWWISNNIIEIDTVYAYVDLHELSPITRLIQKCLTFKRRGYRTRRCRRTASRRGRALSHDAMSICYCLFKT